MPEGRVSERRTSERRTSEGRGSERRTSEGRRSERRMSAGHEFESHLSERGMSDGARAEMVGRAARWGGVARRGAAGMRAPYDPRAERARATSRGPLLPGSAERPSEDHDEASELRVDWSLEEEVPKAATAVRHSRASRVDKPRPLPEDVSSELRQSVGARAAVLGRRLSQAASAYERDRFPEAKRHLEMVIRAAPDSAAAHELLGLTLYRMGRWNEAVKELGSYQEMTGSVDQLPVVMDCCRALSRHRQVEELWETLRRSSPGAELATEGRIVLAGSLADRGRLGDAIALLETHTGPRRHPAERHLRSWFALAHLYEMAGDVSRARLLFGEVARFDPDLGEALARVAALG